MSQHAGRVRATLRWVRARRGLLLVVLVVAVQCLSLAPGALVGPVVLVGRGMVVLLWLWAVCDFVARTVSAFLDGLRGVDEGAPSGQE